MKNIFKSLLIIFICCISIISLFSCSGGIKGDEAKTFVNDFFKALTEENYDKAQTLLHPNVTDDIKVFVENSEKEYKIDFKKGFIIEKYTGFSSSLYNSEIGGSSYELSMVIKIDGLSFNCISKIVKNDKGYGIYGINISAH